MSFFETPPARRSCLVRGWGNLALALGLFALSFTFDMDQEGRIFFYLFIGYFLIVSFTNFRRARLSPPGESETTNPDLAPVPDQVRYYRRLLIVSVIAFPTLSIWTIYQLNFLESGAQESVEVWAPVSFVYEYLGYWPAALSLPLLV